MSKVRIGLGRPAIAERVFIQEHRPALDCWYYAVLRRTSYELCFNKRRLILKRIYRGGIK